MGGIAPHGRDADLKLRQAVFHLLEFAFDAIWTGLKPLQVLEDEIVDLFGHRTMRRAESLVTKVIEIDVSRKYGVPGQGRDPSVRA